MVFFATWGTKILVYVFIDTFAINSISMNRYGFPDTLNQFAILTRKGWTEVEIIFSIKQRFLKGSNILP